MKKSTLIAKTAKRKGRLQPLLAPVVTAQLHIFLSACAAAPWLCRIFVSGLTLPEVIPFRPSSGASRFRTGDLSDQCRCVRVVWDQTVG